VGIGSFDAIHLHGLVHCYKHNPRIELGIAKQYATAQLKAHGFAVGLDLQKGQGIWSKSSHPEPITGPRHFDKTHNYIFDHADRGAVLWQPSPFPEFPTINLIV